MTSMRRLAMPALVLALALELMGHASAQSEDDVLRPRENRGGRVDWSPDLEAGLRAAKADGKPVMIYFTHDF